ncbi:MAG: FG-GAP-like repeat-containing protein [Saprospiraceae bacterium]|nr:FG-GAP-like repeat-containing protein [Saprospiraceae bacterium]
MKNIPFARKLRQLRFFMKQLSQKNTVDIARLRHKFKHLLNKIPQGRIPSTMRKALMSSALLLGMSLSSQAQYTFTPEQINPFDISPLLLGGAPPVHSFVDIDDDGDLDILANGNYGYLTVQPDTSTSGTPSFGSNQVNPFNFSYGYSYFNVPEFVDIDNDGDFDMFVADVTYTGYANFIFYENIGSSVAANFDTPVNNPFNLANTTTLTFPRFVDIDNDGDMDLFNIDQYGPTLFYENIGTSSTPDFATPINNPYNFANTQSPEILSFYDVDNDGDFDVLSGITDYQSSQNIILFYENTGTPSNGVFTAPDTILNLPSGSGYAASITPFIRVNDLDGDGDFDIFISGDYDYGNVYYFENISNELAISFDQSSIVVDEASGSINIDVNIINPSSTATTVDISIDPSSTATAGDDFVFTLPSTVTFPANSTAPQTVSLLIVDDIDVEMPESIVLKLENSSNGTISSNNLLSINIEDNDSQSSASFIVNSTVSTEDDGEGFLYVELDIPRANATSLELEFLPAISSAELADLNFTPPLTVNIPAGSAFTSIPIPIFDDAIIEGDEQASFRLINPVGNIVSAGDTATLIIEDNEFPAGDVAFGSSSINTTEDVGNLNVSINITNATSSPASVDVILENVGDAIQGADYTFTSPTTVTFPANDNAPQTITIPIVDDTDIENDETFQLKLVNITNQGTILADSVLTVTIEDNDTLSVGVNAIEAEEALYQMEKINL